MVLFRDKYRIESSRLKDWDYSSTGWYFVTICARNREHFLGEVIDGKVSLSEIGGLVAEEWKKTPSIRPIIGLDEWVVMPNHIHGIIVINAAVETPRRGVSTEAALPKSNLKSGSLGAIVGQFKSVCTKRLWDSGYKKFGWQPRFYDHIIRSEKALREIRQYILNNPIKWELDRDNPMNLWM